MATVVLPIEIARSFCDGQVEHTIATTNIRHLVDTLDDAYPGLGTRLKEGLAVAIDGEIFQEWLLEDVAPNSEIHFIPAIEGG